MDSVAIANRLPEGARNEHLRRLDWRFLLPLATEPDAAGLTILRRPGPAALRRAHTALPPGGEVHCEWRLPLPGNARRARRRLERAGFTDVRLHWAWPPSRSGGAQFWVPLGELGAASSHLFQLRPANRRQALARRLWSLAAATGALAPLSAIGRKPGGEPEPTEEIEAALDAIPGIERQPRGRSWLLLTGGRRSINKVVGIPFAKGAGAPNLVVKFARVAEAEAGLEREAAVLRQIEVTRPALPGVPRVLTTGRRVGRLALAETALHGPTLLSHLDVETFPGLAMRVTDWLVELAGQPPAEPREGWQERLVENPLQEFERDFAPVGGHLIAEQSRGMLAALPDLPPTCEHRDCSPWNVVLSGAGEPALLDWESAEPLGLPGLDLVYFLANAAFILEGAFESGHTLDAYRRLLDPEMPSGRVFVQCTRRYCDRLGLDPEAVVPLRALCWVVHSRSDHLHLAMDSGGAPDTDALGSSLYLSLLREDLRRHREGT